MSYKLNILHDNPLGFWLLDETSGTLAKDSSPYGNDGQYSGDIYNYELPLVINSDNAKRITNQNYVEYYSSKDHNGNESSTSFGTKETSDNSFTLECWVKPDIENATEKTCLFGDLQNNIGLFWYHGKIIFSVKEYEISYSVPNSNRSLHIVAVYLNKEIYLYVNSEMVAYSSIEKFEFSNTDNTLKSGPTLNDQDTFLLDCPAIYRYALNVNQIHNHYISSHTMPAIQIASPDDGELFKIYDTGVSRKFEYSYPANRSWKSFDNLNLFYNEYDNTLSLIQDDLRPDIEATIVDLISVPLGFDLNSSKIEWKATKGIEVYASVDNQTFIKCQNGFPIPKYKFGVDSFDASRKIYLSIRFKPYNTTKYIPKIYNLMIAFYNDKKVYSFNGGSTLSHFSDPEKSSNISLGNNYSEILSRDQKNGLICSNGSGFNLNTQRAFQTVEFFYTPHVMSIISSSIVDITASTTEIFEAFITNNPSGDSMTLATSVDISQSKSNLIYHQDSGAEYSWDESGDVDMNGIQKIYINGIDRTADENILDLLKAGSLYHICIVLDSEISGDVQFNYSSSGSTQATYQNIIIYPSEFTPAKCLDHFNMWIGKYTVSASDSSMTLTENSVELYTNDWQVLQTA